MNNRYIFKLMTIIMLMIAIMPTMLVDAGTVGLKTTLHIEEQTNQIQIAYTGEKLENPIYKIKSEGINTYLTGPKQIIQTSEYGIKLTIELYEGITFVDRKEITTTKNNEKAIFVNNSLDTIISTGRETIIVDINMLRKHSTYKKSIIENIKTLIIKQEETTNEIISVKLVDKSRKEIPIKYTLTDEQIVEIVQTTTLEKGSYGLIITSTHNGRTYSDTINIVVDGITLSNGRTYILNKWHKESILDLKTSNQEKLTIEEKIIDEKTLELNITTGPIKRAIIKTENVAELPHQFIGIDNEVKNLNRINGDIITQTYAIDPSQTNINNITLEIEAKGSVLYKCAEWNFTTQTCYGEWIIIKEITPGKKYNITIDAVDPAFGEGDGESLADTCTFSDQAGRGDGDSSRDCISELIANNGGFNVDMEEVETSGTTATLDANFINSFNVKSITGVNVSIRYQRQTNTAVGGTSATIELLDGGSYITACTDSAITIGTWETFTCDLSSWITTQTELNDINIRLIADTTASGQPKQIGMSYVDYAYISVNYEEQDIKSPEYNLIETSHVSPATYSEGTTYNFNTTWTDNIGIDTVIIEENFTGTKQNRTPTNDDSIYSHSTELGAGIYTWKYYANDSSGNSNSTESQTFTVNKASPEITLTLNGSSQDITINNIGTITISSNGTQGIVELLEDGTSFLDNYSTITTERIFNTIGTYNITARYNLTNNHTTQSISRIVTVRDTIPPGLVTELNNNSVGESWILWIWTNPIDTDFDHVEIWINGTFIDNTTTTSYNITGLNSNTEYEIQIRSVDSHEVVSNYATDIGTTKDSTDLISPELNNIINDSITVTSVSITWITNEIANSLVKYGTMSGSYTLQETDETNVISHSTELTNLEPDTTYYYVINSSDVASNSNESNEYNFTTSKDIKSPEWSNKITTYTSPTTYNSEKIHGFNITWTDNVDLYSTVIEHNFSGTLQNYSTSNAESEYYYTTTIDAGTYIWKMYANDTSGNVNVTTQETYIVNKAPSILKLYLNSTENNYTINEDEQANITASIETPSNGYFYLYMDGSLIKQGTSELTDIRIHDTPGIYNITATYLESNNYYESNITKWLTVYDGTSPVITTTSPINNHNDSDGIIDFIFDVQDHGTLHNCSLLIDGSIYTTIETVNVGTNDILKDDFTDGTYTWNIECSDDNNIGTGIAKIIIIDKQTNEINASATTTGNWDDADAILISTINATDGNLETRTIAKNMNKYITWTNITSANIPPGAQITKAELNTYHMGTSNKIIYKGLNWFNGSEYIATGCAQITQTGAYRTDTCDLSSLITTREKANDISIQYLASAGNSGTINIDHIYATIEYIKETTIPLFENIYNITADIEEQIIEQYNATDNYGMSGWTINDSRFDITSTGLFTNATTLTKGKYIILVRAIDLSNNYAEEIIQVEVADFVDLNLSIDTTGIGTTVKIYNSTGGLLSVGEENLVDRFYANKLYDISYSTTLTSGEQITKIIGLNLTENFNITTDITETYSGILPAGMTSLSPIYAFEQQAIEFTKAEITMPKAGLNIEVIAHCTDWNFTSEICSSWEVNDTSNYEYAENSTHFMFNVSEFDAFGGGPGDTLPNLTSIKIYDVTNNANKESGGIFINDGLDTTFNLITPKTYRVEFNVTNEGRKWTIDEADDATHTGLNESWTVENIWYNIDGTNYTGGTFDSGIITWNLSLGGVLNSGSSGTWYYIFNTSEGAIKNYPVSWLINDTNKNSGSVDYSNYTTYPAVDLIVNGSSIELSKTSPVEGEEINISLEVYNIGKENSSNFTVKLYDGVTELFSTSINITNETSWVHNYSWTVTVGKHNFTLKADTPLTSEGIIEEGEETNNEYSLIKTISSWHTFYGSVQKITILGINETSKIYDWISSVSSGNLYFADSDAIIDFNNLQAIGRTKTGIVSTNDFLESDKTLGTENYEDNITTLFATDYSTPKQTRSYTSYAGIITTVPYINTTSSGNFTTGMMWDTSNSTNNEYDEGETIIFVTEINTNKDGAYGNYDYEIKIPSKLQTSTGIINTVSVYMELE